MYDSQIWINEYSIIKCPKNHLSTLLVSCNTHRLIAPWASLPRANSDYTNCRPRTKTANNQLATVLSSFLWINFIAEQAASPESSLNCRTKKNTYNMHSSHQFTRPTRLPSPSYWIYCLVVFAAFRIANVINRGLKYRSTRNCLRIISEYNSFKSLI